jgi:hypothetical protein
MEIINRAATAAIAALALPLASESHNSVELKTTHGAFQKTKHLRVVTKKNSLNFKDEDGKITTLILKPWQSIREVKALLAENTAPQGFELLVDNDELVSKLQHQRLYFQGQVLQDTKTLQDYKLKSGDTIYRLAEKEEKPCQASSPPARVQVVLGDTKCPPELQSKIEQTQLGLDNGVEPCLASSGLGGTYFLRDKQRQIVGVFKPEDEEAYCPNNPRGLAGRMGSRTSAKSGLLSGEANVREVAAYLLDHDKFANVPATVRVEVTHQAFGGKPKVGSFQEFKPHDDEAGDVSASLFSVEDAHRIGIMDIRLLNRDRNDENLLVKKSPDNVFELIPIDHGCSLPDSLEVDWYDWAWLSWPQMKKPLSAVEKAYIARLDAEEDATLLSRNLNIRWQCLLVLHVTTLFLQKGAAADLSLYDIASMMTREEKGRPSTLEVIFAQAKTLAGQQKLGGKPKRRSPTSLSTTPTQSPVCEPAPTPKLRRSRSLCNLDLDAFKLPGIHTAAVAAKPCDDFGDWMLEDNEELFDDDFFKRLGGLMDTSVLVRQQKRRAVEVFKLAMSPTKMKA